MVYSNGQDADAPRFNSGSMDREVNTDTVGNVGLLSTDPLAGSTIGTSVGADGGIQRLLNALSFALGIPVTAVYNYVIAWSTNVVGSSTDSAKLRIENLTNKFLGTPGLSHAHSGVPGQGEKISATNLLDINNFFGLRQITSITGATGGSTVITTAMSGKTPGGGTSTAGVITSGSFNRAELKNPSNGDFYEDGSGNRVYGRVTEASGIWTLTYYIFNAGTETPYSFSGSNDIDIYFVEVFTQLTRPTISPDAGAMGSADATADVVDASATQRGVINTLAQSLAGVKTFLAAIVLDSLTVGSIPFIGSGKAISEAATKLFWDATNFRLGLGNNAPNTGLDLATDLAYRRSAEVSVSTFTALSTVARSFIGLTGTTASEIQGIANGFDGKELEVHNETNQTITFKNDNAGASAANRIYTTDAGDLSVAPNTSAHFKYNATLSRWLVTGGGGGGGGGLFYLTGTRASPQNITAAGGIAFTGTKPRSLWFIQGNGGHIDVTASPQIAAGTTVGQELVLVARNNDQTVTLENGTGLSLNGPWVGAEDDSLTLVWDGTNWTELARR